MQRKVKKQKRRDSPSMGERTDKIHSMEGYEKGQKGRTALTKMRGQTRPYLGMNARFWRGMEREEEDLPKGRLVPQKGKHIPGIMAFLKNPITRNPTP
jgi:hypothetical protein